MDELTEEEEKVLEIINAECEISNRTSIYRLYIEREIENRLGKRVNAYSLIENLIYLGKIIVTSYGNKCFIKPVE